MLKIAVVDDSLAIQRSLARLLNARVIVLSNCSWEALREAFLEAGACAYFDKGMQFEQARDWIAARAMRNPMGGL